MYIGSFSLYEGVRRIASKFEEAIYDLELGSEIEAEHKAMEAGGWHSTDIVLVEEYKLVSQQLKAVKLIRIMNAPQPIGKSDSLEARL